jgi:iron complex outermembrane recepter protein
MRSLTLRAAIAAALACVFPEPAHAADPVAGVDRSAPTPDPTLHPVLVIGIPPVTLPANMAALDEVKLQGRQARSSDTAGLLDGMPGVARQAAGGASSIPVVRGLAGDRNRILVDGMDFIASCPNHMNPPLSYIDPAKLGSIRVYAGITPVSAGGDSIGGIIVAESRPARFGNSGERWESSGEIGLQARSNGNARSADLSFNVANERLALSYDGSVARADNYRAGGDFRDHVDSGREGHELARDIVASSAYLLRTHTVAASLRSEQHYLQAILGYQEVPRQLYPNQRMDMLGNAQSRLLLRYAGEYDWGGLDARAWGEAVEHRMDFGADRQFWYGTQSAIPGVTRHSRACDPVGFDCAAGMPMLTESRSQGLAVSASLPATAGGLLRVGSEFQRFRLDDWWPPSGGGMWPDNFWNIRDGRRNRLAAFVEWEGELGPRWSALAGVRTTRILTDAGPVQGYAVEPIPGSSHARTAADAAAFNARRRRVSDLHLDLSLLARYQASARFALEAGYARKTRSPNLYERYAWSTWAMAAVMNNTLGDGNGYVGDIGLKPETADTVSASFVWQGGAPGTRLMVTPFVTWVGDFIDAVALSDNGTDRYNVLRHANQRARLAGVDLLAERSLAQTPHGTYALKLVASHLRGENRDTGAGLYHAMPSNARISLTHRHGRWEGMAEWVAVARKSRLSDVRNEQPTAGHALLNLQARWQHGGWRLEAGVDNLFDRLYDLPLGGQYLAQGRTMGINSVPHGIPVPGPGRSFHIGVSRSF